ncbi:hypothetical protein [Pseudorhodoferax sp. Leaf274]|uniref:hypothetical protein n=1 Tax=Pseudorhodoferax sp. Leaf274 TaxID=1736318 RepID=UPI0012E20613|nr:hypothetical protein [Pseudorhodoferax sp. Leaf274]
MAQILGALCALCLLGMWLALESDRGPMAGALLLIGSFFGICSLLWGAGPLL